MATTATAPAINKALSVLIMGESKAGKSLFSVSGRAPRLLLDVEASWRFLPIRPYLWDPKLPPPTADPSWDTAIVAVKHWDDAKRALDALHGKPHPFKSVSLDSVSELQYRNIEKISGGQQVQLQMWGTALREVGAFCRQLRDLTEHPNFPMESVVVTSMARKGGDDGIWRPYLQGQMRDVIPYLFDIIAFLEKDRVMQNGQWVEVRKLYTEETVPKRFIAGGRITGRIPSPYLVPTIVGTTDAEISKQNTVLRAIVRDVFARSTSDMVPAAPIPVAVGKPVTSEQGDK